MIGTATLGIILEAVSTPRGETATAVNAAITTEVEAEGALDPHLTGETIETLIGDAVQVLVVVDIKMNLTSRVGTALPFQTYSLSYSPR